MSCNLLQFYNPFEIANISDHFMVLPVSGQVKSLNVLFKKSSSYLFLSLLPDISRTLPILM